MSSSGQQVHEYSTSQSRTAANTTSGLNQRSSTINEEPSVKPAFSREQSNPYEPDTNDSTPPPRNYSFTKRLFHIGDGGNDMSQARRPSNGRRKHDVSRRNSVTAQKHSDIGKLDGDPTIKTGLVPRPVGGNEKLGMFSGVYVPTCLNVLSILMFLRFGFILGLSSLCIAPSITDTYTRSRRSTRNYGYADSRIYYQSHHYLLSFGYRIKWHCSWGRRILSHLKISGSGIRRIDRRGILSWVRI